MPALDSYPVVVETPVAWGEMDAFLHVNNAVYFTYIENARMEFCRRVGILETLQETGVGPILHSTRIRFRLPLEWPDTVAIAMRVTDIQEDRFTTETVIWSRRHDRLAAEAESLLVMFDYRAQKKAPVSDELRARIAALEKR